MKSKLHIYQSGAVIAFALLSNSALADDTSDRIENYKANGLVPQELSVPTADVKIADDVVVFKEDNLAWTSGNYTQVKYGDLITKYGEYSLQDFKDAFGEDYAFDFYDEFDEMRAYLSAVGNGELSSDISANDAIAYLQGQLNELLDKGGTFGAFPFKGLDISNKNLNFCNLIECTGITAEQIASTAYTYATTFPAIDFTDVDLSRTSLYCAELSKCTGLTGTQIATAGTVEGATLPSVDFTGVNLSDVNLANVDLSKCTGISGAQIATATIASAILPAVDFSGVSLSSTMLTNVDLRNCTGLNGQQISSSIDWSDIHITQAQYDSWKSDLAASMPVGRAMSVYVGNNYVYIYGTKE